MIYSGDGPITKSPPTFTEHQSEGSHFTYPKKRLRSPGSSAPTSALRANRQRPGWAVLGRSFCLEFQSSKGDPGLPVLICFDVYHGPKTLSQIQRSTMAIMDLLGEVPHHQRIADLPWLVKKSFDPFGRPHLPGLGRRGALPGAHESWFQNNKCL